MMRKFSVRPTLTLRGRKFKGLRGWSGKPTHPPLTDFPVAAYVLAAVFDVIATLGRHETWARDVLTTFANDGGYDEMVVARDIPFHSLCAHHLLPFVGVAHVAYIPGDRVVGLSKLARVVEHFARRLQTQEQLTTQVADALTRSLAPRGVGVVLEAEHLCISLRGLQSRGVETVTSSVTGLLRDDAATRAEFLGLARGGIHQH